VAGGGGAPKPAQAVTDENAVTAAADPSYSRAAHKLAAALDESGTAVAGRVLDAGASTGGFTQVCLARGAAHVYAVDVGHGQLVPALRADPRVTVHEGLNLRDLTLADVGGSPVDLIVADVSFISLTYLVGPLAAVLKPEGTALLLVKPQFEVGRGGVNEHGVVVDEADRQAAVARVVAAAADVGWRETWRGPSRTPGKDGNQEWFVRFANPAQ